MRLLFITTLNPYSRKKHGGAESSLRLLAEKMASRGHDITYLTRGVLPAQYKNALLNKIRLRGCYLLRGQRWNLIFKLNSWFLSAQILTMCLRYRIELIHCFYQDQVLEAALRVKRVLPELKIVMRMAGMYWYERSKGSPHLKARYSRYFSHVDAVNYISKDLVSMTADAMKDLEMNVRFQHSFVLDIGSSAPVGRNSPYPGIDSEPFRMIMAARFSDYQKRQDLLLQAISLISDHEQIELILIGEGIKEFEMKQLAEQLGVQKRVKFEPFLHREQLWRAMEDAHLLCHCVDYEGLGKVIIESMALGLPVLASDVRPLNTYIEEGGNGFLVENRPEVWAAKIIRLRHSVDLLLPVSLNSMEYVRKHHDPEKNIIGYEKEFASIVGSKEGV